MKVLVLSCNTGQGHNSAGHAIVAEFQRRGIACEMMDALAFDSQFTSKMVCGFHNQGTLRVPKLYGIGISAAKVLDRMSKKRSVCYVANTSYATALKQYVEANGYDTLVLPHVFPAEAITRIRRKFKTDFSAYFIATDYAYPPFLSDTDLDFYFIPHEDLALNFAKAGLPGERLIPMGIPVAESFSQKTEKLEARRALRLPEEGSILLIMTGSMGFGDTEPLVKELLRRMPDNTHLVVMGGKNEKMKARLRRRYGKNEKLRVLDFTTQVSLYMDAADLVFTKPGGLSSTEAAVKRIPMIHTRPIPGWEQENIAFFRKHGLSLSGPDPEDLVTHALWLLGNPWAREQMISAQERAINKYAARDICDYIVNTENNRSTKPDFGKE